MRKHGSKWRDIRLRKAINYAINREELWEFCAKGNAHSLGRLIPRGASGYCPDQKLFRYDTAKARSLLAEAGFLNGFEVNIISPASAKLETQIIGKMLERVGLKVKVDIFSFADLHHKIFIPMLDKRPEEEEWDIAMFNAIDLYGNSGALLLNFGFVEESDWRWIEYDPIYERMWGDMAKTKDSKLLEAKTQELARYVYDRAYLLFIYVPLSLYAVNKEVDFIPQKCGLLRLKETSVTENHWSLRGKNNQ